MESNRFWWFLMSTFSVVNDSSHSYLTLQKYKGLGLTFNKIFLIAMQTKTALTCVGTPDKSFGQQMILLAPC